MNPFFEEVPNSMKKLFQRFQNAYEPMVVMLIVGVALVVIYALYRATGGGGGAAVSIVAVFDDVTGIKERSKVLFKGMPVGTVRQLNYDSKTDRILVRLDILQGVQIPANIQPFLEKSLFGEAHIALRTNPDPITDQLLAEVAGDASRDFEKLLRFDGIRLSTAESLMPGFDGQAKQAIVGVMELTEMGKKSLYEFHSEMSTRVTGPVQDAMKELRALIMGPEGQADKGLAAELQSALDDLEKHSTSLEVLFNGKQDGSTKGLIQTVDNVGDNWDLLVTEVTVGKDAAVKQLEQVSKSLDKAGAAIARSESQVQKLGSASDKLGQASESVKTFMDVMKVKPNSLVWGMNQQQKSMLDQKPPTRSQSPGAGKR
jgi:ABC-type transporter Mla subunit MlaD